MQTCLALLLCVITLAPGIFAQSDFQCPELMGRYQDPFDCQRFYVCSYGTAHQFTCDNGTRYDHDIGVCRHAVDVICRTGNQLMTEVFTCPTMNGMYRDTSSCNHFYMCANGRHFRLACPPGLQFNGAVCTWKSAHNCHEGLENEVGWNQDLKIPDNDFIKEELPMYKGSFDDSHNDVEFENEYYDNTPEEGGSEFPRFVEKVKPMEDVDAIQIGLLAPKGKKMLAETTDKLTSSTTRPTTTRKPTTTTRKPTSTTRKPTTQKATPTKRTTTVKTTTTRKPTTTTRKPTTTTRKPTTTTRKPTTTTHKTTTTGKPTTSKATTTSFARKVTKKVAKLNKTTNKITVPSKTTQKGRTTVNVSTKVSTAVPKVSSKKSDTKSTTTAQTMKAVKYNGAKALLSQSSAAPNSTTNSVPTKTTGEKSTTQLSQSTSNITLSTVPTTSTNVSSIDDNNVTISLENETRDANVSINGIDSNMTTSDLPLDNNSTETTSSLNTTATSASTKTDINTTVQTKHDKSINVTKSTSSTTPSTSKTPSRKRKANAAESGKKIETSKFQLDTVHLMQ